MELSSRTVWILGLMHSGTTIVWRSFRKNKEFLCYDEPFSGLDVLPRQNSRNSYGEFVNLLQRDQMSFWQTYAPLHPLEELNNGFTSEQIVYLKYLLSQGSLTAIDETHLHLHIAELRSHTPNANVVHLYRRARSFVTSHLHPSRTKEKLLLRKAVGYFRSEYNKWVFWSRNDLPPDLRRDLVIGDHALSKFGLLLAEAGYDSKRIMSSPALVRMLAYWHYHFHYLERHGPLLFGDKFRSLRYEDFATHPDTTMMELYQWLGMPPPSDVSYSDVHRPKPAFCSNDRRWNESARIAGFSEEELDTLL